jgi:hypothetical protein
VPLDTTRQTRNQKPLAMRRQRVALREAEQNIAPDT